MEDEELVEAIRLHPDAEDMEVEEEGEEEEEDIRTPMRSRASKARSSTNKTKTTPVRKNLMKGLPRSPPAWTSHLSQDVRMQKRKELSSEEEEEMELEEERRPGRTRMVRLRSLATHGNILEQQTRSSRKKN
eukprot:747972-Hanusia_phi.AAC.2